MDTTPFNKLKNQITTDVEQAYGWFANLSIIMVDNGIPISLAGKAANAVMKQLFEYDMFDHMHEFEAIMNAKHLEHLTSESKRVVSS